MSESVREQAEPVCRERPMPVRKVIHDRMGTMELSIYSQEIQNYINEAVNRRKETGFLDGDVCQQILEYAAETNSDTLFGIGYYYLAEDYWRQQDAQRTMHCLGECTKCFLNANVHDYLARAYNMMGMVSDSSDNRLVALSYYYTSLQYAERYGYVYECAIAEGNIAHILIRMKHYKHAREHYYHAIDCFKQSEDTANRVGRLIQSMIYCVFCHLLLEEWEEALALWGQIQETLREHPGYKHPEFCLRALEAGFQATGGNRECAMKLADSLEQAIRNDESLPELEDIIVIVADILDRMQSYDRLERLIRELDEKEIENNTAVYLDLYPFKSRLLLRNQRIDEYMEYTRQYLKLYQKHIEDSNEVTARILELQDKLRRVEVAQKDIRACNQELETIALYDSMTNLANRTYLNEYLSQQFEEAYAKQEPFGVELMDIDHFKQYNDTYGHLMGDECIEAVAGVLKEVESEKVFCARYGGDEFMIVYTGMSVSEIRKVASTIQNQVRDLKIPHKSSECADIVTVSQGIFTRIPEEENREWDFNSMADVVLYEAKREGRNRYHITTDF